MDRNGFRSRRDHLAAQHSWLLAAAAITALGGGQYASVHVSFEIIVIVEAIDTYTSSTMQARHSYSFNDGDVSAGVFLSFFLENYLFC